MRIPGTRAKLGKRPLINQFTKPSSGCAVTGFPQLGRLLGGNLPLFCKMSKECHVPRGHLDLLDAFVEESYTEGRPNFLKLGFCKSSLCACV